MNLVTFADLKATDIAERINMCSTDERFRSAVNRAIRWLMLHGNWWGTYRLARLPMTDYCLVMPGAVASLEAVYSCDLGMQVTSEWYPTHPGWNPGGSCNYRLSFQQYGTVATQKSICTAGVIRVYAGHAGDYGKTITFLGYDSNGAWVQTEYNGVLQDGETLVLADPYTDSATTFSNVTTVRKEVTLARVMAFTHTAGQTPQTNLSQYEYWETNPQYMRYKVIGCNTTANGCENCGCQEIDCMVKLEFIPVRQDNDFLMISNLSAIELALEALKAKDDGDYATADALMFGTKNNTRLGAIPMLQQELQNYTANRTSFKCRVHGTAPLRRQLAGFI